MTVSRPQLHIFHTYVWRGTCTKKRKLKLFHYVRRQPSGPVSSRQCNESDRIGSTVTSLSGISLAGLLTFLWVMHLNIAYNNIFLWHGGKECVCGQPSYMRSPSYFATPSFKLCTYIIPSYPSWVFSNILRQRPSNCEING